MEPVLDLNEVYRDYVDHSNDDTDPITVDKLLDQMDEVYNTTAFRRNKLISKMMQVVDATNINPAIDDIDDVTKKISIITTANQLLNDSEKGFAQRVNMRLKQKEASNNIAMGQLAVDVLKRISLVDPQNNTSSNNVPSIQDQLNKLNEIDHKFEISDDECKLDSTDIPELEKNEDDD